MTKCLAILLVLTTLVQPAPATLATGYSTLFCNCTSSPVEQELCHSSKVTVSVGGSIRATGGGAKAEASASMTVETGLSTCTQTVVGAGECTYFEYTFNCQKSGGFLGFFQSTECALYAVFLKSRPATDLECG